MTIGLVLLALLTLCALVPFRDNSGRNAAGQLSPAPADALIPALRQIR